MDMLSSIRKLQDERGLKPGERALKGALYGRVNSPERVANYI